MKKKEWMEGFLGFFGFLEFNTFKTGNYWWLLCSFGLRGFIISNT